MPGQTVSIEVSRVSANGQRVVGLLAADLELSVFSEEPQSGGVTLHVDSELVATALCQQMELFVSDPVIVGNVSKAVSVLRPVPVYAENARS